MSWASFLSNPDSEIMKHIVGIGYAIFTILVLKMNVRLNGEKIEKVEEKEEQSTELLAHILEVSSRMVERINQVTENKSASETADSFAQIEDKASVAVEIADELSKIIEKLADSNKEIVESIQTISAVTEEISAHSNQTLESSREDGKIVAKVTGIVDALNSDAEVLMSKA